nr:MAG TPA_asm: RecR protein [Caudoviricetes sp.]
MLMLLLTSIVLMVSVNLIHHLGLAQAIAEVMDKILKCSQCLTFWSVIVGLIYLGQDIVTAIFLAISMAYISNWFGLILLYLQRKFTTLYEREREKDKE